MSPNYIAEQTIAEVVFALIVSMPMFCFLVIIPLTEYIQNKRRRDEEIRRFWELEKKSSKLDYITLIREDYSIQLCREKFMRETALIFKKHPNDII